MKTEAESGVMQTQAKGSWERPGRPSPLESSEGLALPAPGFQTCGLQNFKRKLFCCFTPQTNVVICGCRYRKLIQGWMEHPAAGKTSLHP